MNQTPTVPEPPATIPEVIHFQPDGTGAGLYTEAIDLKQIGLKPKSAAVTDQTPILANHPVAGDDDGPRVAAYGPPHGTNRFQITDRLRQVGITYYLTPRDPT